ncbi:MAG: MFS transporter, partial [bacterium]
VGFAASTFVPQVQIISNWFVKRRGFAMGVSNSAQGFAAILNLAVPVLIGFIGWRNSYTVLAGFTLIVAFPFAALLLRDHPHEKNTVPDAPFLSAGERAALVEESEEAATGAPVDSGFAHRVLSLHFALIGATYGAIAFVFVGTVVHIVPLATDQGFTPGGSAVIFLLWGLCILGANLISGISDRFGRAPTYALGAAAGIAACVLLATFVEGMPPGLFYMGAALSGLSLGLTRPTASALLADHFAGPGFGMVNGSVMLIFALFGAAGAYTTGFLFDAAESYRNAFLLLAAAHLAGAVFAVSLGRMKRIGTELS